MKFRQRDEDKRNFLKLKDGETISGIFRGDLFEYRLHWADNRGIVCTGHDCELCKAGNKSKFRFRLNFIVKEGKDYVAKVFEQGWKTYELLSSMNDSDYPLEKYVLKITRRGIGLDTSYSIMPAPNGLVSAETEAKLKDVSLNVLDHITEAEKEPAPVVEDMPLQATGTEASDMDIPF